MTRKIVSSVVITSLFFSQVSFVFAQTLEPVTINTTTTTEPISEPVPEPEPVVEETVTPPADTTGPAFISVATASAEETEVTVVWTTDELAYGFVEYGETMSYDLSTPKSASAELDHTIAITNLTAGTVYHYRIVAEDESGNVSYSKDRTLETALEVVAIDNAPPEISEISVTDIATSSAIVSWVTDELAQGKIEYGKTAEYGASSPLTADYATTHSASIANLDPDTEYHYRVVVQDESGNEALSPDEIFITDPFPPEQPVVAEPDSSTDSTSSPQASSEPLAATTTSETTATSTPATIPTGNSTSTPGTSTTTPTANTEPDAIATTTPFAISHIETALVGTSTARIIWRTNEPATSRVFYGASENYASSSPALNALNSSHEIKLTGLNSGTNYFYKVVSKNASGKTIEKSGFEFNTLFRKKTTVIPPAIAAMRIESVGTSSAIILFDTNVPATGQIKYGTTTSYAKSDLEHAALLTKHRHPLSGLAPNTGYNFVAVVRDVYGNETIYQNQTFRTFGNQITTQQIEAEPETVVDQTTVAPEKSSGGGGDYPFTYTPTHSKPAIVKVEALDKQVMFVWNPQKPPKAASGSTQIRTNIVITRSTLNYFDNPTFGKMVYKGNSGVFTDTRLENGKTYYYSVFKVNQFNSYSQPVRFKVVPTEKDQEITLKAAPTVAQKTPIYKFSKILARGDKNKQVEHLQVLLASESSIYQRGLITGYFGPLTERAVKTFQKRHKLSATGVANMATLKKLEQLSGVEVAQDKAAIYDKALARNLAVGHTGGDVSVLQQFLVNAEVYPEALVTGRFGPLTRAALQRFQQEQNITPAEGFFGPITKKRVLNLIRLRSVSL